MYVQNFYILSIFILVNISTIQGYVSYNEFCNETIPCNQSSLLSCQDSVCACILQESMTFSEVKGHCLSLADEACGQMSMDTSEVLLQCASNSFCNNQGYCQCAPNHYKDVEDGYCKSQKDFGEICQLNSVLEDLQECTSHLGLVCVNKTCNCNRSVSIDSFKFGDTFQDNRRCLGRAGFPCLNDHCVPNSNCKENNKGLKTCVCQSGFEKTVRGLCLATFNKTCDIQNHIYCKRGLACLNGLCQCHYPRDQIYKKRDKKCVALVGGPCHLEDPDAENTIISKPKEIQEVACVANAICQKNEDDYYAKCECEEGFVENKDRRCDIGYGQPCSSSSYKRQDQDDDDDDEEQVKCDQLAQLTCRDGHCLCIDDGEIFDKNFWKCRGLVGSHCKLDGNSSKEYCVKHAECKGRRNGRFSHGQCQCKEDTTEETDTRTCSCTYCNDED